MATSFVYLVRHGEQDLRSEALSELGRGQSHLLGQRLRTVPFSTIHHSPLPRAAETASILAEYLPGVPSHACEHVTDRTPMPASPAPERYARFLQDVPVVERDPGTVALRAAVAYLGTTGDADRHELVVTHNFVIGWFVRHALDAPEWRWLGLNQSNCGLTIVRFDPDGRASLVCFNDTGHLASV